MKAVKNDLDRTVATFGFDTAVHFATECIDRLHSTAESHQRVLVVEVMAAMPAGLPCTPVQPTRPTPSSSPRSLTISAMSSRKCASASATGGIFRSSWWLRVRRPKTAAAPSWSWKKNPPGKRSGSVGSAVGERCVIQMAWTLQHHLHCRYDAFTGIIQSTCGSKLGKRRAK